MNYTILLPIYKAEGVDAELYGIEAAVKFHLSRFRFEGNVGSVRGLIPSQNENLPMIPPVKGNIEISYKDKGFIVGIFSYFAGKQDNTGKFEEPTKGYVTFGLFGNYSFLWLGVLNSVSISVDNIFNTEYRNHLSRIKSIMPEPGRNIRLNYKFFL